MTQLRPEITFIRVRFYAAVHPRAYALGSFRHARSRAARGKSSRGLSSIEILTILLLIGMFATLRLSVQYRYSAWGKIRNAYFEVIELERSATRHRFRHGCPGTVTDLEAAGIVSRAQRDPWGETYVIRCSRVDETVDVSSYGPDRKPGGGDDIHSSRWR